jgi:L-fucose isomerase-like protein
MKRQKIWNRKKMCMDKGVFFNLVISPTISKKDKVTMRFSRYLKLMQKTKVNIKEGRKDNRLKRFLGSKKYEYEKSNQIHKCVIHSELKW